MTGEQRVEQISQLGHELRQIVETLAASPQDRNCDVEVVDRLLIGKTVVRGYEHIEMMLG